MTELEQLKSKLKHYEKIFGMGDYDPAIRGYKAYVKIINQQIDHIDDFDIKAHIDGKKTETVMYERTESMWAALPTMISKLNALRLELKIEFNSEDEKPKQMPTSPQSIG